MGFSDWDPSWGFDPHNIKSTSPFYSPRAGDFVVTHDKVLAAPNLGSGDLEAVPGFIRDETI